MHATLKPRRAGFQPQFQPQACWPGRTESRWTESVHDSCVKGIDGTCPCMHYWVSRGPAAPNQVQLRRVKLRRRVQLRRVQLRRITQSSLPEQL
jgi:hypothetical protein